MLKRALSQLPTRKRSPPLSFLPACAHVIDVATICKFAQLDYKHGEKEIGRSMFEDLLSTYPKRTDVWGIYLETETSHASSDASVGDVDRIRALYDRAIGINSSLKKMKQLFKKYLRFETKYGDQKSVAYVKTKAKEYVESRQ